MVKAAGVDDQPLEKDTVLCVKTSEGRIGRLKVTSLEDWGPKVKFEAVIWNLASDSAATAG
ncbi:hypothetical protein [Streptomyces scopuliridis]|uniref:hypothetical protein n=1 Tax=Streptomyces scopuliridis TaxID=452529 RepID=UPI0036BC0ABC